MHRNYKITQKLSKRQEQAMCKKETEMANTHMKSFSIQYLKRSGNINKGHHKETILKKRLKGKSKTSFNKYQIEKRATDILLIGSRKENWVNYFGHEVNHSRTPKQIYSRIKQTNSLEKSLAYMHYRTSS